MNRKTGKKAVRRKSRLKEYRLVVIPIISVILIVLISVISYTLQTPSKFSLNAAIIDQLGDQFPNATFRDTAMSILKHAGFNTTYYDGQTVNVTFFQELAEGDYGIIILRAHSALRQPNNNTVDLFTSEEYNNQSYRQMWNEGYLARGTYLFPQTSNETYFAVTPDFIENLKGNFPRSIIIAMGCWSLKPGADQLAKAFLDKGAEAYIGWTNIILPRDTDNSTAHLLEMLVTQDLPLAQAVKQIQIIPYTIVDASGNHGFGNTEMLYLPYGNANLTLSKLIASVGSSTSTVFLSSFQSAFSLIAGPTRRLRNP